MMTSHVTLSAFVQGPTRVIAQLDEGDVVLTRREGQNLRLSVDARDEAEALSFAHAAEVVGYIAREETGARLGALRAVFPWAEVLTDDELGQFAAEYYSALRASASLRAYAPLETVENAWRSTAEIKADPALRARIQARLDSAAPRRVDRPERPATESQAE